MSWTIRSKTEKTSLASTDGVPMQEAGGTTKWFSLSSLSTFFGISTMSSAISTLQGYFTTGSAKTAINTVPTQFLGTAVAAIDAIPLMTNKGNGEYVVNYGKNFPAGANDPNVYECTASGCIGGSYAKIVARLRGSKTQYVGIYNNSTWSGWAQITDASGNPVFPVVATTASAANAYIAGNGNTILQSTSSAKYKTDIVTLDDSSTLDSLRPVLYKSNPETVPGDDPTKEHYGFIAEELDEIDEKLVQYVDDVPNGVQYDRITVLLVKRIHELEARLAKAGI